MHNAYLAGLIDGEGSIMLTMKGRGRARRPEVSIGMTDHEVIEAVQAARGGRLIYQKRKAQRDMLIWSATHERAFAVLEDVLPYLVIERRRALAKMLLDDPVIRGTYRGPGTKVNRSEYVFQQMRKRNALREPFDPPPEREHQPTDDDIAYLAGIIDGEGHVTPTGAIQVSSTDPELPNWLRSRFGGRCYDYVGRQRRPGERAGRPQRTWNRGSSRFVWAARVADHVLIERKRSRIRDYRGPVFSPEPEDATYLTLRGQGVLKAPAAREAGISLARARLLESRAS